VPLDEADTQPDSAGQVSKVVDAHPEQGEAGAFLLAGEADRGRGLGHGLPDGSP
jgi:hypothetical protein